MALHTIFKKPVDRPIEGVIKADDEASLRLEFEEYVLTNEITKRLENFLYAYNNYEGANGVWISGFFGSGKSHLLKILALLLENRSIDGKPVSDLFLPKCIDNEILRADLNRAVSIPSKSILFNIDQKADVISKKQIDALLSVFVKVFDEMCGYYGKQGHIAQFERDLDSRGIYEQFKQTYKKISGREWEFGREQALLESRNIAEAYSEVTSSPKDAAIGILDKYRNEYKVSIEDFADQVFNYIERQPANFRLNFFVDEVGQYIADNIKLMTNLQTIAESLATRCRGRAWVIVTAQEDMNAVVGEMDKQQGNDFSKIQARFANRMKLTSTDVAEVIQKRLLTKNDDGVEALSKVYHSHSNNFKTFFDFADGSKTYRNFQDRDQFIHSYPFIPYQFELFQAAIQNLSYHSAFEGKHSSVGERSMLGVFQQVAVHVSNNEIGKLATFDLMFEGIRTALKSNIQRAILSSEKNLDNTFAIQVLKALFLVKYVKEFKATIRNLCIIMFDSFDMDLPSLRKQVEEAVNLLEQQTYIQRNGDQYEFLTDEEKDVEQEIKNTDVDTSDVSDELAKIIFDIVIKNRKIRFEDNGQDYPFSRRLDDRLFGRESELGIHVISPFHEYSDNEKVLRMKSIEKDDLLVIMPSDDRLIRDMLMYKRTEKYIVQNISIAQQESVKRILTDKRFQNNERYAEIQAQVQKLLGKSKLVYNGGDVEVSSEDAQTRINAGFHEVIRRVYSNLRMLRGIKYSENDISKYLKQAEDGLFGGDVTNPDESEQDMIAFIKGNKQRGVRTTLKVLIEKFERKPYGWYLAAILCTLAKLCARGKVEVIADTNTLENSDLERALTNTHGYANVVLEPQTDFTPSQVRRLKEFYENFFNAPPKAIEAKDLGRETEAAFKEFLKDLGLLAEQAKTYPFSGKITDATEQLKELKGKQYAFFLTEMDQHEDRLLDLKEDLIDPLRRFINGPQRELFDNARDFLKANESNFADTEGDEAVNIQRILADPACFKGDRMQQAKSLLEALQSKITSQIETEKQSAISMIAELKSRMSGMDEFKLISSDEQNKLIQHFDAFSVKIENQNLIAVIRDALRKFEENEYPQIIDRIIDLAIDRTQKQTAPTEIPKPAPGKDFETPPIKNVEPEIKETPAQYVAGRSIRVSFDKAVIENETDMERYIEAYRESMLKEIKAGKKIRI